MKSDIEKVGVFWDFRYLPISDYERNAQMLIKYRDFDSNDNFITVCSNCHRLLHAQISCVVKHVQPVPV